MTIHVELARWEKALEVIEQTSWELGARDDPFGDQARGVEGGIPLQMGARRAFRPILTIPAMAEGERGKHGAAQVLRPQAGALVADLADSLGPHSELRSSFLGQPSVQRVLQEAVG